MYIIFLLTADLRRRTQTFLRRDPRGKKHVNRCAIKKSAGVCVCLAVKKVRAGLG
jgi:hypothetical protein